jgi:hypothetical protein
MNLLMTIILSLAFSNIIWGQNNWHDTSRGLQIQYPDTCNKLKGQSDSKKIPGADYSRPLILANGIVIRGDEIQEKLVDTIFVIKCPQSFAKFGDLGALGVISIDTKQNFESVVVTKIASIKKSHSANSKLVYSLNGYLFTDTTLKISTKAVKRVDFINNFKLANFATDDNTTCISIWTITKKEMKDDNSIPKPCRGVGFANVQ